MRFSLARCRSPPCPRPCCLVCTVVTVRIANHSGCEQTRSTGSSRLQIPAPSHVGASRLSAEQRASSSSLPCSCIWPMHSHCAHYSRSRPVQTLPAARCAHSPRPTALTSLRSGRHQHRCSAMAAESPSTEYWQNTPAGIRVVSRNEDSAQADAAARTLALVGASETARPSASRWNPAH